MPVHECARERARTRVRDPARIGNCVDRGARLGQNW